MWVIHVELELPQDLIQDLLIIPQHFAGQVKRSRDQDQWRFCPIGGAADPLQGIIYIAGCYRGNVLALCNRGNLLRTVRSEEHTSELQSLMRISYAVFCLKK